MEKKKGRFPGPWTANPQLLSEINSAYFLSHCADFWLLKSESILIDMSFQLSAEDTIFGQVQWFTPVTLVTQEVEMGGSRVEANPGETKSEIPPPSTAGHGSLHLSSLLHGKHKNDCGRGWLRQKCEMLYQK
jgi:hypothetical protein